MSFLDEFKTVDLILGSNEETCAVDAFALSLIKAERQARKLLTYLVYQSPAFSSADWKGLRRTLAASSNVYFDGVIKGLNALSPVLVSDLVGPEYPRLCARFGTFSKYRNKIFHGQITSDGLGRAQLLEDTADIRTWWRSLAENASRELGYDGFGRNSFRKSQAIPNLSDRLKARIGDLDEYKEFIRHHMERQRTPRCANLAPGRSAATQN